eukprot:GHVS01079979.1.p1 GENE.GHVS01079979.1~~GHVS01079979.1.p1  ORF type:complete len:181 (+),score=65.07 GHVS01079979.1:229-771(+)
MKASTCSFVDSGSLLVWLDPSHVHPFLPSATGDNTSPFPSAGVLACLLVSGIFVLCQLFYLYVILASRSPSSLAGGGCGGIHHLATSGGGGGRTQQRHDGMSLMLVKVYLVASFLLYCSLWSTGLTHTTASTSSGGVGSGSGSGGGGGGGSGGGDSGDSGTTLTEKAFVSTFLCLAALCF